MKEEAEEKAGVVKKTMRRSRKRNSDRQRIFVQKSKKKRQALEKQVEDRVNELRQDVQQLQSQVRAHDPTAVFDSFVKGKCPPEYERRPPGRRSRPPPAPVTLAERVEHNRRSNRDSQKRHDGRQRFARQELEREYVFLMNQLQRLRDCLQS